ncbi:hypothetical protein [Bacillus sp. FJAT-27445]|uniref:hypothetical protein n=1 Tax=Bacillus sp. FJAT-27445 TaxID=1679166 RepID=UPI0007434513|nr:hypothetical protein [Bacillus sp. FJAT-27445]
MRKVINVLLLAICFIALVSCSLSNEKTMPLSNAQLDDFIKSNELNVLAVEEIANRITVIMFENETTLGFYTAYVRDGKIESGNVTHNNNTESTPISTSGVASGIPFATIKINDQGLIQKAEKIRVTWDDGKEIVETVKNQNALIIPYDDNNSNIEKNIQVIELLDAEGNIIFHQ